MKSTSRCLTRIIRIGPRFLRHQPDALIVCACPRLYVSSCPFRIGKFLEVFRHRRRFQQVNDDNMMQSTINFVVKTQAARITYIDPAHSIPDKTNGSHSSTAKSPQLLASFSSLSSTTNHPRTDLVTLVGHSSAEHVIVDSDTDHGLSNTAAYFSQDLPHKKRQCAKWGVAGIRNAPWGSGSA
jgi:hypothetical protein